MISIRANLTCFAALLAMPSVICAQTTPVTDFPYKPSVFAPNGDANIHSGVRSTYLAPRPSTPPAKPDTFVGQNVEMFTDGSGTAPSHPESSDWSFSASAFKNGYAGSTAPKSGEIDAFVGSVRQDNGDTNVYGANGQIVDRGSAYPAFLSTYEGISSSILVGQSQTDQEIDVQLGIINTLRASGAPGMIGVHAVKQKGAGGVGVNVASINSGAWDYGLRIANGSTVQLEQRSNDGSLMVSGPLTASSISVSGGISGAPWNAIQASCLTVSAATGSIGDASAYARYGIVGKTATINLSVHIQTNGSGAGAVKVTLPADSPAAAVPGYLHVLAGRANAGSGKMLDAVISNNVITIYNYDNSYPGANDTTLLISGSYEAR